MSLGPVMLFVPLAERNYGSIELFDETFVTMNRLPFRYSRFHVGVGQQSNLDQHDVLEVWVILLGSGKLLYDGAVFPVAAGQVVQFGPQKPHQVSNDGATDLVVFSFWWEQ